MNVQRARTSVIEGVGKLNGPGTFVAVEPNLPLAAYTVAGAPPVIGVNHPDAGIGRLFGKSKGPAI
jgi:hypothetical protein